MSVCFSFSPASFVNDAREEFAYTLLVKKKVNGSIKEFKEKLILTPEDLQTYQSHIRLTFFKLFNCGLDAVFRRQQDVLMLAH